MSVKCPSFGAPVLILLNMSSIEDPCETEAEAGSPPGLASADATSTPVCTNVKAKKHTGRGTKSQHNDQTQPPGNSRHLLNGTSTDGHQGIGHGMETDIARVKQAET